MTTVSNEAFILSQSDYENELHFYRVDRDILEGETNDYEKEIQSLYQVYKLYETTTGEGTDESTLQFTFEMSEDNRYIRLIFSDMNSRNQPNFFNHLWKRVFPLRFKKKFG